MTFPTEWKVIKFHGSKPPTSIIFHVDNNLLWNFKSVAMFHDFPNSPWAIHHAFWEPCVWWDLSWSITFVLFLCGRLYICRVFGRNFTVIISYHIQFGTTGTIIATRITWSDSTASGAHSMDHMHFGFEAIRSSVQYTYTYVEYINPGSIDDAPHLCCFDSTVRLWPHESVGCASVQTKRACKC